MTTRTLVVDASVLVAALTDSGSTGEWALESIATHMLHAPELGLIEATNILRRFESAKLLSTLDACQARDQLHDLPVTWMPYEPFAERVWELRSNVTAYDAIYIAVAEALEAPLATLDEKLANASGSKCGFRLPGA